MPGSSALRRREEWSAHTRKSGSIHYICIQHTFLLEVMRDGILCQERRLDLNLGGDPFTLRVRCIGRVVAGAPAPGASADRRTFNLLELPEVAPHFIADSAGNVDLQFYDRHEVPPQSSRERLEESPKRTLIIMLIVSVCSDNRPFSPAGRQIDKSTIFLRERVDILQRCPATIPFRL